MCKIKGMANPGPPNKYGFVISSDSLKSCVLNKYLANHYPEISPAALGMEISVIYHLMNL